MSGILTVTTGGVFILLINRYAVVIQASVIPALLGTWYWHFPNNKVQQTCAYTIKEKNDPNNLIFFHIYYTPWSFRELPQPVKNSTRYYKQKKCKGSDSGT